MVGFKRIGLLPGALGGAIYAGGSIALGSAFASGERVSFSGLKRAASLLLVAETTIRPVYLGVGKTWQGSSAFYLYIGQP